MRKLIAMIVLTCAASLSHAAELTLFDIPLRTATRGEINNAITKAGGKLSSSTRDVDKYDARDIGMPGATALEVVYLGDKLVMAQYTLDFDRGQEERVRKMITAKYGQPKGRTDFDAQYLSDGKYRWHFDHNMELVFTKEFFSRSSRYLSYVNKTEEARLGKLVKDAENRAIEKEANAKKNVF